MFLPIGDTPNPRGYRPFITWGLIAANVAVYVLVTMPLSLARPDPNDPALAEYLRVVLRDIPWWQVPDAARRVLQSMSAYDLFAFAHGYKPGAPEWSDLFMCMFLHGGVAHLAGNMLFLWIFGDNVEHRLGRLKYLVVYLATGVFATWTFSLFARRSMVPLVGASGAISGVLGAYFLLFPRNRIKTFVFLFPFVVDVWLIPVRWVIGFYILVDNLFPFLVGGTESGVAYGAHLGGFAGGLFVGWLADRMVLGLPLFGRQARKGEGPEGLRAALAALDRSGAIRALSETGLDAVVGLGPEEAATLAVWLEGEGQRATAFQVLRRYLRAHPSSAALARIHLTLGQLRLREGQVSAAFQHLLSVFDHDPDPETAAAAQEALQSIPVDQRLLRRL